MTDYIIPLTPDPQSFSIVLAGREYRLTVRWFAVDEGGWVLDIAEPDNAAPILAGLPLVTGCDLFEQYGYLGFGGMLWVASDLPPSLDNLGKDVDLVFTVKETAA